MKQAISVTVQEDNLLWLRAQAAASTRGNVSEVLDRLVTAARAGGQTHASAIRSVVGTVDLPADDADLSGADAYVRSLYDRSVERPMLVHERAPSPGPKRKRSRR